MRETARLKALNEVKLVTADWSDRRVPKLRSSIKTPRSKPSSALDAATQVLAEVKSPMTTKELVDAMAAQRLWKSPEGKTTDRTLYSAIAREILKKGKASRFKKAEKGKFALRTEG
jgi:hypothetical protein